MQMLLSSPRVLPAWTEVLIWQKTLRTAGRPKNQ
jgi:hypothetical protein